MTSPTPTPKTLADTFFEAAAKTLGYLWGRWQDEKEYEDFANYILPIKKIAEQHAGVAIVKMTKRPFAVTFTAEGKTYIMDANSRSVGYKRIA